jgi:hypothetical protein
MCPLQRDGGARDSTGGAGVLAEGAARTALDWPGTGRACWAADADGAWSACRQVERAAVRQRSHGGG